jgi:hypothetical protein
MKKNESFSSKSAHWRLIYFFIILSLILSLAQGCKDDNLTNSTTTPPDPDLLFSATELLCNYIDSLHWNDTIWYFFDSLKYTYDQNRTFTKIKIIFEIESYPDTPSMGFCDIRLYKTDTIYTNGDTTYNVWVVNNKSYQIWLNIKYPTDLFKLFFAVYFYKPQHNDFIKLKNVKVYKAS